MSDQPSLQSLREGDSVAGTYLVQSAQAKTTKNGDPYLALEFRDATTVLLGMCWTPTREMEQALKAGQAVHVAGRVTSYRERLQIEVQHAESRELGPDELRALLPVSPFALEELEAAFHTAMDKLENPWLQQLRDAYLADDDFYQRFLLCPAAVKYHHAYLHGLLEHVVSLLRAAFYLAKAYDGLVDRDILFMLCFLHDHGKVWELSWDGAFEYTVSGQLVGHIPMGLSALDRKIASIDGFPRLLADQLRHGLLAHHGEYEFGSPKIPMTLEAQVFHYIDNIDANIAAFPQETRQQRDTDVPGPQFLWSQRQRRMLLALDPAQADETEDDFPPYPR